MAETLPIGEFHLPLFPLPNLVFFPNTRLPLHIFEPRYRQMVADALKGDHRIGVVLLKPGWETDYYGTPPSFDYGTVGVIEQTVQLSDGRYNMMLNGLARFRIVDLVQSTPYRIARVVTVAEEQGSPVDSWAQREWLADLSKRYLEFLPGDAEVPEIASANLDALTSALIMSLAIEAAEKQQLLELPSVLERAQRVGSALEKRLETLKVLAPFRREGDPTAN